MTASNKNSARERILSAAYALFTQRGVRDVAVDEIIRSSDVAIATFYRHFRSKDELVTAFLNRREEIWTTEQVVGEAKKRSDDPEAQLLAIFDVFDDWFNGDEFEGDSFVNVLIEMGSEHPLGQASITHLTNVRRSVAELAQSAGLQDAEGFAKSYQILMKGSIITATMGEKDSAQRVRPMARWLINQHKPHSLST